MQGSYWKINKLGFVNFWKFKEEEIFFSDGCALIRGHNGSGKSIATQSAITFMLDGSMRGLDPSGTNSRQMSYYLLGDKKEQSTGYVYMEFTRNEIAYFTLCIGMRARRNVGIDFWGFCVNDGRRIGKDILLHKDGIPLTKREVKALIVGNPDNFFTEKQKDYEKAVNHYLFGLSASRYRDLIRLLTEIRKPIAGADRRTGLQFIYGKLNNSLPVLKDDDFELLSTSLEAMDKYHDQLKDLKAEAEKLKSLRDTYEEYRVANQVQELRKYFEEQDKLDNIGKKVSLVKEELENLYAQRKEAETILLDSEFSLEEYGADITGDSTTEFVSFQTNQLEEKIDKTKDQIEEVRKKEAEIQSEIKEKEKIIRKKEKELKKLLPDMEWRKDLSVQLRELLYYLESYEKVKDIQEIDLQPLKDEIRKYIGNCIRFQAGKGLTEILELIDAEDLPAYDKLKKIMDILFSLFIQENDQLVERNGYLKNEENVERFMEEIEENQKKKEILQKEFLNFPSLKILIEVEKSRINEKKRLEEEIGRLQEKHGFSFPLDHGFCKDLISRVDRYSDIRKEKSFEEKNMEQLYSLLEFHHFRMGEFRDKLDSFEREYSRLTGSTTEELRDIETIRENIISSKMEIKNLDQMMIPMKKQELKEKEKEFQEQEELVNKLGKVTEEFPDVFIRFSELNKKYTKEIIQEKGHIFISSFMEKKEALTRFNPQLLTSLGNYSIVFFYEGREWEIEELCERVGESIEEKERFISEEENEIYQKILMDCLSEKINHQIDRSKIWVEKIAERMRGLRTTSGKVFSLRWEERVKIDSFSDYFKANMENYHLNNENINYSEFVKECLDYRNWYEFHMEMNGKELTDKRFLNLSGGERATAIYSTLLSALNSLYSECEREDHPALFASDEAFTICDNSNISAVFGFIGKIGLDYLLNSQSLWGTYPTVRALAITQLTNQDDRDSVIVTRFRWDGKERIPQFTKG